MTAKTKPVENAIAATPSDTTNIDFSGGGGPTRALYVGSGGDISVEMFGAKLNEKTVVFVAVLTGTILPIAITRVNAALTTATSLVAIW